MPGARRTCSASSLRFTSRASSPRSAAAASRRVTVRRSSAAAMAAVSASSRGCAACRRPSTDASSGAGCVHGLDEAYSSSKQRQWQRQCSHRQRPMIWLGSWPGTAAAAHLLPCLLGCPDLQHQRVQHSTRHHHRQALQQLLQQATHGRTGVLQLRQQLRRQHLQPRSPQHTGVRISGEPAQRRFNPSISMHA